MLEHSICCIDAEPLHWSVSAAYLLSQLCLLLSLSFGIEALLQKQVGYNSNQKSLKDQVSLVLDEGFRMKLAPRFEDIPETADQRYNVTGPFRHVIRNVR